MNVVVKIGVRRVIASSIPCQGEVRVSENPYGKGLSSGA
jgi:hypothetical protein